MPRKNTGPAVKWRADRGCFEIIEYVAGKRKRRATNLRSLQEAEEKRAELIASRAPSGPVQTVGRAMAFYVERHAPTVARPDNIYWLAEKLAPFWGSIRIDQINRALCQQYAAQRNAVKKLSNETIRKEIEQIQAAVNFARENGLTTFSPVFWKPDKAPSKTRWLTGREAARLIRAAESMRDAREYLPLFIIMGLYTAQRSEAILSLRWPQVDFKRMQIDFRPGQVSDNKGRGVVPIPQRLYRELVAARQYGTDIGYVIHRGGKRILRVKKGFAEACRLAGLEGVSPHTLRHTAISWQVQRGSSIHKVAKWAGHSTSAMIERVYGHLQPEHLDEIAAAYGGKRTITAPDTAPKGKARRR